MSESAAVTRTAAREPTKRQVALAKAILDPNVKTKTEAGRIAGYSHRNNTYEALASPGAQIALETFKTQRLDKARALKSRALERALERVDSTDDQTLAVYAKVGHDIAKDSPEDEPAADPELIRRVMRRAMRLAWRFGYRAKAKEIEESSSLSPSHNCVPIEVNEAAIKLEPNNG